MLTAPTGGLTIDLGQPITVGSLNIRKAASGAFDTTIQGSATNTLTFDGGTTLVNAHAFGAGGTGVTIIEAPIVFNSTLTINQSDQDGLRLMQSMSGTGSLNYTRLGGSGVMAITGANTYQGPTVLTGQAGQNFLLVRLNSTAIPGGIDATGRQSNITFADSVILGLRADDFKRNIGTGDGQFQFTTYKKMVGPRSLKTARSTSAALRRKSPGTKRTSIPAFSCSDTRLPTRPSIFRIRSTSPRVAQLIDDQNRRWVGGH